MPDQAAFVPLNLSDSDMLTKALPGEAPGDVSDARTSIFTDANLATTEDWHAAAAALDRGDYDAAIAAEEAALGGGAPHQPAAAPQPQAQEPNQPRDEDDDDPDYVGSIPAIGMFGPLDPPAPTPAQPAAAQPAAAQPGAPAQPPAQPAATPTAAEAPVSKGVDQVESLALSLKQQAETAGGTMTLREALELAERTLGVSATGKAEEEPVLTIPEGYPTTREELKTRLRELEDLKDEALADMEFSRAKEIKEELRQMQDWFEGEFPKLENAAAEAETAYFTAFEQSQNRVLDFYPMAKDANSDFVKDMAAIDQALEATGDPRFHDPNKPLIIAQQVAQRRGILPMVPMHTATGTPQIMERKFQAPAPIHPLASGASSARSGSGGFGAIDFETMSEEDYYRLREAV